MAAAGKHCQRFPLPTTKQPLHRTRGPDIVFLLKELNEVDQVLHAHDSVAVAHWRLRSCLVPGLAHRDLVRRIDDRRNKLSLGPIPSGLAAQYDVGLAHALLAHVFDVHVHFCVLDIGHAVAIIAAQFDKHAVA